MDWDEADDNHGLRIFDFDPLIDDDVPHEIIDLDPDSPVQVQHEDNEVSCKNNVLFLFPDICPDYLAELALQHNYESDAVISAILDKQENGENYPTKTKLEPRSRKRKRTSGSNEPVHHPDHDSDDEGDSEDCDPECVRSIKFQIAQSQYSTNTASPDYANLARVLLSQDFPRVPQNYIRSSLSANKRSLFETYISLDEKLRNRHVVDLPWQDKKTTTKINHAYTPDGLPGLDVNAYKPPERAAFAELIAAREVRIARDAKLIAEAEESNNFRRAKIEGQTTECGICFEECALNRMIQCEGEMMHWFCRTCMRSQAESQIGMAKYELACMSLDGCTAGFSQSQRAMFLDKKLTIALDRIEQEAVLRMAGIENLETCPFCPYAAEYPPVEVDKEFRCDNPRCQLVSCRLCRRETHIPKTCAEADADRGLDARHMLEEAMSEALIRRCNKCQSPFVKQDGCNKIKCTKCGTLHCDVCRKTIQDYSHFNDLKRGGKAGQCPLFDESQRRYETEVSSAEAQMRKKVVEENPDVDEETLHITTSKETKKDKNTSNNGGFAIRPPDRQPQPAVPKRPHADAMPAMRFGDPGGVIQPYINLPAQPLQNRVGINNPMVPSIPVVHRPAQQNPVPRPDGRAEGIVKAAGGMVQKAINRPVSFRKASFVPPNAMAPQAPRPRFETFLNRVENLKRKNAETRRFNNIIASPFIPCPGPSRHQNHGQMAQAAAGPILPRMDLRLHPSPGVPGPINSENPFANADRQNAVRLEGFPSRAPGFGNLDQLFEQNPFRRT
ncbi:hypothetical protein O1611_g9559 [Lasiodiplodia mahajangana]|uniref:Uncharacterized protein n=1 Tax=Lasiodiplodia mahajangana TaxID=1108764 RepID=A0ACC2J819_9PEZI|nr:hypothetical protein O1611_g9559 [Lasiodiplodia mahajangana]